MAVASKTAPHHSLQALLSIIFKLEAISSNMRAKGACGEIDAEPNLELNAPVVGMPYSEVVLNIVPVVA